jgi:hypothetical protein
MYDDEYREEEEYQEDDPLGVTGDQDDKVK